MIERITRSYTRRYSDTGQVTTYVEWLDRKGAKGRTEGDANGAHMRALLARAEREGIRHVREEW